MAIIGKGVFIPPTSEDNRIFATRSAAEDYLETALAKAGQNVMIYDSGTDKYKKFIIQDNDGTLEYGSGGSSAVICSTIEEIETPDTDMDYYVGTNESGFVHYRYIVDAVSGEGELYAVGGDTGDLETLLAEHTTSIAENTSNIATNTANIRTASDAINTLSRTVNAMPNDRYFLQYGTYKINDEDADASPNVLRLIRTDKSGNDSVASAFQVTGGSGTGNTVPTTVLTVEKVTPSPIVTTRDGEVKITINYSSLDGDNQEIDGTYTWKNGNQTIESGLITTGQHTFDLTKYCSLGTQQLTLSVRDNQNSYTMKTWTVQIVDVRIASSFNDTIRYTAGNTVEFSYIPYGGVEKTVHFVLDGVALESAIIPATQSGTTQYYTLPAQTHGAHLLECYITATIGSGASSFPVETSHIYKDIIWYDSTSTTPIISSPYRYILASNNVFPLQQYGTLNIPYTVHDPTTVTPTVTLSEDGTEVDSVQLTTPTTNWSYHTGTATAHTLTIAIGNRASIDIHLNVSALNIDASPVTSGLAFDFNPAGLTNSSTNRLWHDSNNSEIALSVSEEFDWANGGYKVDENNIPYFSVRAGNRAYINYKMFEGNDEINAATQGAEMKLIFMTENVRNANTVWFTNNETTVSGATTTNVGIQLKAHEGALRTNTARSEDLESNGDTLSATDTYLFMPYSEDDKIELDIDIVPIEEGCSQSYAMSYEDGVPSKAFIYGGFDEFYQDDAKVFTIGSDDCDVRIYRMKVYSGSLGSENIMRNFIADASTPEEMLDRYYRNAIYWDGVHNEYTPYASIGVLTPEGLATQCPDLKVLKLECPCFTMNKRTFQKSTLQCLHKNGDPMLDNWLFINGYHSGQGTTSDNYGVSGRNVDFLFNADGVHNCTNIPKAGKGNYVFDPNYVSQVTFGYGMVEQGSYRVETCADANDVNDPARVSLTRTSVPNNFFNFKVNIASSENANNALLQKRYNDYLTYQSLAKMRDSHIKNDMEFVPAVLFIRETDDDLTTHTEFNDTQWHFYALGNLGDSKKTDYTRAYDPEDMNEFTIEISDNPMNNATFQSGVYLYNTGVYNSVTNPSVDDIDTYWEYVNGNYVKTTDTTLTVGKTYYTPVYERVVEPATDSGTFNSMADALTYLTTNAAQAHQRIIVKEASGSTDEMGNPILVDNAYMIRGTAGNYILEPEATPRYVYPIDASTEWTANNRRYDTLYNEDFDGDHSFEPRYACCGDYRDGKLVNYTHEEGATTEEKKAAANAQLALNEGVWRAFYRWVITSTDEEFEANLDQWCVRSAVSFWYVFTHHFTMMDNRAKNTFWHFAKTGTYRAVTNAYKYPELAHIYCIKDGNTYTPLDYVNGEVPVQGTTYYTQYAFDLWDYDNDTAIGINNNGALTYPYGKEDTDYLVDGDPTSGWAYNGALSGFWCRLRDLCGSDLQNAYNNTRSSCWNAETIIKDFDTFQESYPEEVWRLDIIRKYVRPFDSVPLLATWQLRYDNAIRKSSSEYLQKRMLGRKKYHRRQWLRDQYWYFGTKMASSEIGQDENCIIFRFYDTDVANLALRGKYDLQITPYSDMYVRVMYGTNDDPNNKKLYKRAKANSPCIIPSPVSTAHDLQVKVYGAPRIKELSDLSRCYTYTTDFSAATKLQKLVLGNPAQGYTNSHLTSLDISHNKLLKELDIRNCTGLSGGLDLSECINLQALKAVGSNLTAVSFANHGKIEVAQLPSTIHTLSMENLDALYPENYICDSMDSLRSLTIEGGHFDTQDIVDDSKETLRTLRIVGLDWTVPSTALLNYLANRTNAAVNPLRSTLIGRVTVTGSIRTPELANYNTTWTDLDVEYNPSYLIIQYPVVYKNYDGSIIKRIYVDAGDPAPDIYYDSLQDSNYENYISLPERPENAQYYYTFGQYDANDDYIEGSGWDNLPSQILGSNTVVNAQYTATAQQYTVKWYSDIALSNPAPQVLKQETVGYGTSITYDGVRPTKAASGINYYIFSGWSASTGCVDRNLDVYPVWEYAAIPAKPDDVENPQEGDFQLQTATPAQLFALREYIKGLNPRSDKRDGITADDYFANKDYYDLCMGHDYNFSNVTSTTLVDVNTPLKLTGRAADIKVFDGSSADRPAIKLFDANAESFTLAVDFRFTDTTSVSGDENTLISCFAPAYGNNAHRGFRLQMSSHPQILWGNQTTYVGNGKKRDIVVLRHIKGSDTLYVYSSNGNNSGFASSVVATALTRSTEFETDAYLCLGGVSNPVDNGLSNYGTGYIYWAKVWSADLGVDVATEMAAWPREIIRLEYAKVPDSLNLRSRYALAGGSSSRTIASFIANNPLADRTRQMNSTGTNAGGWAETNQMRPFLNGKFYSGLPTIWQSLIAQCSIPSTAGSQSSTITYSDDYVYIPSYQEMLHTTQNAPYGSEGAPVLWFNSDIHRAKFPGMIIPVGHSEFTDAGDPVAAGKTVREGDIWKKNGNGEVYIYALPDTIDNKGLSTTNSVASSGDGTWIVASGWWGRSPDAGSTNAFWIVSTNGYCSNGYGTYASNSYAVVPSLSI